MAKSLIKELKASLPFMVAVAQFAGLLIYLL